jgi:hypothetical protein
MNLNENDLKLKLPFGAIIAGPSSSGKTQLCLRLLEHREKLFEPSPRSILYAYGQFNKMVPYLESKGIQTIQGTPSE